MSWLTETDGKYHYPDSSHRWLAEDVTIPQDQWEAEVRAHVAKHQEKPWAGWNGSRKSGT